MTARSSVSSTLSYQFILSDGLVVLGRIARQYTYQEFPEHFVWKENQRMWALRKRAQFAIGRMYFVSPLAGERFYLRTLLSIAKGPQSYEDLRTVGGVLQPSFRDACMAHGLLEDDGEWRKCLEEAAIMQTGYRLRQLFSTILLHCGPIHPEVLWQEFRHDICDDLKHQLQTLNFTNPSDEDAYDYGLYLLDGLLREAGCRLADFSTMPHFRGNWDNMHINHLITEQLSYNRHEQFQLLQINLEKLNDEQHIAYTAITDSIERNIGGVFFLNGPAGTGKTFVYKTICHKVRSEGWIALCVASSGIAALLLPGGRTSHMMFKIPVAGLSETSTCRISKNSPLAELIRHTNTRVVIWDEVPAQHRFGPEAVDRTFRDLRGNDRPFGGITVVFGGDFQQTLPVVPHGSRAEIVAASLRESHLWQYVKPLHLHWNMRLEGSQDAEAFAQWLLDVGHGRGSDERSRVKLPHTICDVQTLDDIITFVYAEIDSRNGHSIPLPTYLLDRMILSARNEDASQINEEVLRRFPGSETIIYSADSIEKEQHRPEVPIPVEFLRSLNPSSLPPALLRLKVGCPLILLRNLAAARGLCNGTRMVVERMSDHVLEVSIIGGDRNGMRAFIPRVTLSPSESNTQLEFVLRRRQFPVRLAFAMTINKSQGQSVQTAGIDLRSPVFTHGQLYVALSRVTDKSRLKVLLLEDSEDGLSSDHSVNSSPRTTLSLLTTNVVYPEVLLD